ncbi:MAG: polysaccharide pyruvyl transferase family protein [Thermoguttaceae bacterium]|nr:polysaccharide pyruvyl transferase family protein [Thermoguttaceae bacterium]
MSKYVIITGGELFNKGAQAMSFTMINEFARRFPDKEAVLFSYADATRRSEEEKRQYKFKILRYPGTLEEIVTLARHPLAWLWKKKLAGRDLSEFREIFENAAAWVDVSGYALGSNWKPAIVRAYILRVYLAKRFGIPMYLMPQSFGPFDFKSWGWRGRVVDAALKRLLKYPRKVMAREREGFELLTRKYGLKNNLVKTLDLVLLSKGFDPNNVYRVAPPVFDAEIAPGSVAIVPNGKNNKYGRKEEIYALYYRIIDELLAAGKRVYFVYHAAEDLTICNEIKAERYADNPNVVVIDRELSCVDFSNVVGKFDFVVASRYHSVVHSYKEAVPTVILGWAVKYRELAETFEQSAYCFDVREALDGDKAVETTRRMCERCKDESAKIAKILADVQTVNVCDYVEIKE